MRFFYLFAVFFTVYTLYFPISVQAEDSPPATTLSFSEQHVYPFLKKAGDRNSQYILAAGVLSVALVNPQDDQIRSQWKGYQKMSKNNAHSGDLIGSGAVGILSAGGQYFFDSEQTHWISHARALVWSTVASSALKYTMGRPRPGNSDDHYSFPSGHTTTAFATATSLSYAYGWKMAVIAYPVAAFVAFSRLSDDVHWGSDVTAGAYLGFWAARASYYSGNNSQDDVTATHSFFPIISPKQMGLGWVLNL